MMSITYIEQIPPVDEMPEWAQEAFHSASFFKACLEHIADLEELLEASQEPARREIQNKTVRCLHCGGEFVTAFDEH